MRETEEEIAARRWIVGPGFVLDSIGWNMYGTIEYDDRCNTRRSSERRANSSNTANKIRYEYDGTNLVQKESIATLRPLVGELGFYMVHWTN